MNIKKASPMQQRRQRTAPSRRGRKGDPRMNQAVKIKDENPEMELLHALLAGGFVFPQLKRNSSEGFNSKNVYDIDGVTLWQRKNQLLRRLRETKQREQTVSTASTNEEQPSPQLQTQTEEHPQEPTSKLPRLQQLHQESPSLSQQQMHQEPSLAKLQAQQQMHPTPQLLQQQQIPQRSPLLWQQQIHQEPSQTELQAQQTLSQSPSLLRHQFTQQSTPQLQREQLPQELQYQSMEGDPQMLALENMLQRQEQLLRWPAFLLPFIQMGVGTAYSWNWLNGWCAQSRFRFVPIFTEEDERRELQILPEQELSMARADITGSTTSTDNKLTIEQQQSRISALRSEVAKFPLMEKVELLEAISQNSSFYDDPWLLRFLQADDFHVENSAKRITAYWRLRVEFLVREKAFLPFTIKNVFSEEEIFTLKMGPVRILPNTDEYGRAILFVEPARIQGKIFDTIIMLRSFFYVFHAVLDDPENGENGIVIITNHEGMKPQNINLRLFYKLMRAVKCFPFRLRAIHSCNPKSFITKVIHPFGKYFSSSFLRQRLFVHEQKGTQLLEQLKIYGLPPERLPTELGGSVVLDHEKWIDERIASGL